MPRFPQARGIFRRSSLQMGPLGIFEARCENGRAEQIVQQLFHPEENMIVH